MAELNVNPTRMELSRIKKSLAAAERGHRLLKDKRDELMRRFLDMTREAKELREKTEAELSAANRSFAVAAALLGRDTVASALLIPKREVSVAVSTRSIMSVEIPSFRAETRSDSEGDIFSYGYAFTGAELDKAVSELSDAFGDMLRLAELEKGAELLAAEIERTRRRVNALEYVMIPNYRDTIRRITMKLDETERSNTARLMKVKDMIIEQNFKKS